MSLTRLARRPTAVRLLTTGLTALALGALVSAQEDTGADPSAAPRAREERGAKAILHLADGRTVRGRAREVAAEEGGGWELLQEGQWVRLPAESLARVALERDVLAQAKKLERELGRDAEPVRRVAYADWLLAEGLSEEALRTLDRVLAEAPDQAQALALLERANVRLGLPEPQDFGRYAASAARYGPAGRELAIAALRTAPEVPGLFDTVLAETAARDDGRRLFAVHTLRRLFPGRGVKELLRRAILDRSSAVRTSAALGLRAADDEAVIAPALRALGSRTTAVRQNAAEALGTMGYAAAVEPLYAHLVSLQSGGAGRPPHANIFIGRQMAYIQDYDVEVAQGAAIADPIINVLLEGDVLDAGVIGVTDYQVQAERSSVRGALSALTGETPGNTTAAWTRWWDENGDAWRAGGARTQPSPTSPGR